mmetsp:Transcript_37418/g.55091  ORF Transcript_37418/g.55091 Transcript_37418/m.55091 type:complete len:260 (-) Transcript_37418:409-1188(-)
MILSNHRSFLQCLLQVVMVLGTKLTVSWAVCDDWCQSNIHDWNNKCTWHRCNGCQPCQPQSAYPNGHCKDWCAGNDFSWSSKCTWPNCSACTACNSPPVCYDNSICENWCGTNTFDWVDKCTWKKCCGCSECGNTAPPAMPPINVINPMPAYSVCVPSANMNDQPTPNQCTFSRRCSDDSDCGGESCSERKCGFVNPPPPIYNCYYNTETSDGNTDTASVICGGICTSNSDCSSRTVVGEIYNYTGCDITTEHGCSPLV